MSQILNARRREAAGKTARACLSVMLALFFAIPTSLLSAGTESKAYAAAIPDGYESSGMTCKVIDCLNPGPGEDDYNTFTVEMPDGQTITAYCQDHGLKAPAYDGDEDFEFYWQWNGEGYDIFVVSNGSRGAAGSAAPYPCQDLAGGTWRPTGGIELHKSSSNPEITDGNSCYDLSGCKYGIYSSREDAEADANAIGYMTTGSDGTATYDGLPAFRTYYVREVAAGQGYKVSPWIHDTYFGFDAYGTIFPGDEAHFDPSLLVISKYDENTSWSADGLLPQGNASLAGAVYEMCYFDGYYSSYPEAAESGHLKKTWRFKTNDAGMIDLADAKSFLCGGDALYTIGDTNAYPLGTYTIREVEAPEGYLCSDKSYSFRLGLDQNGILQIVANSDIGDQLYVHDANQYVGSGETVQRGDLSLVKTGTADVNDSANDGEVGDEARELVPGVKFQLLNSSENAVASPQYKNDDGSAKMIEPGGVVCEITTNKDGVATTKAVNSDDNGWSLPEGWTSALAFGDYTVHEVIPDDVQKTWRESHDGHSLISANDFKATISSDGQDDPAVYVNNKQPESPLKIVKVDSETGKQIPLTCSFKLYDADGELVTYTSHYPEESVQDTWTSAADGTVVLPMKLAEGKYTIEEVTAPTGYALALDKTSFEVTSSTYNDWTSPLSVQFKDTPIKGKITIQKTDEDTGAALEGATFKIVAASDIVTGDGTVRAKAGDVVQEGLVSGKDGKAVSQELYLGTYKVIETAPPTGYCIDETAHSVSIESQGQTVPVVSAQLDFPDSPTKLIIDKTIAGSTEKLAGATFQLYDPEGLAACGFDFASLPKYVKTALGSDNVEIEHYADMLEHADEFKAGETLAFTATYADKDGDTESADFKATLNKDYTITLALASNPDKSIATIPALQQESKGYYNETAVTDENGAITIKYLKPGTYALREVASATGYHADDLAATWKVVVDEMGRISIDGATTGTGASATVAVENQPNTMHTTLKTDEGKKVADMSSSVTLVDTIAYDGAIAGQTYTAKGTLHLKNLDSDGNITDGGIFKDASGKEITAETEFVAQGTTGTVDVTFTFDATDLHGTEVVAFEQMLDADGAVQMKHEDITDKGQTVKIQPKIGTELLAQLLEDGSLPWIELDEADARKILGDAYVDKAAEDNGGDLAGAHLYSYAPGADASEQTSYSEEALKAAADLLGITLEEYKASLEATPASSGMVTYGGTSMTSESWSHTAPEASGEMTLVDTVAYIGLTPGVEHVMRGTLMDKSTGYVLKDADGNPVTAETRFTPETANGTVDVTFTFDAAEMHGKQTVAYESCSEIGLETTTDETIGEEKETEKETVVAVHEDITDEHQTVTFPEQPDTPGDGYDKTGDIARHAAPLVAGAILVAGAAIGYGVHSRRSARREEEAGE